MVQFAEKPEKLATLTDYMLHVSIGLIYSHVEAPLLLGNLHDLIQSALNSSDQFQTGQTDVAAGNGSSNMTPLTPQRGLQTSQGQATVSLFSAS